MLPARAHRVLKLRKDSFLDFLLERFVALYGCDRCFDRCYRLEELFLQRNELLDGLVRNPEGIDHVRLGYIIRRRLDHNDSVFRAGHGQIQVAAPDLLEGRVDDELTVDAPDADASDGRVKRDVRAIERRRSTRQR